MNRTEQLFAQAFKAGDKNMNIGFDNCYTTKEDIDEYLYKIEQNDLEDELTNHDKYLLDDLNNICTKYDETSHLTYNAKIDRVDSFNNLPLYPNKTIIDLCLGDDDVISSYDLNYTLYPYTNKLVANILRYGDILTKIYFYTETDDIIKNIEHINDLTIQITIDNKLIYSSNAPIFQCILKDIDINPKDNIISIPIADFSNCKNGGLPLMALYMSDINLHICGKIHRGWFNKFKLIAIYKFLDQEKRITLACFDDKIHMLSMPGMNFNINKQYVYTFFYVCDNMFSQGIMFNFNTDNLTCYIKRICLTCTNVNDGIWYEEDDLIYTEYLNTKICILCFDPRYKDINKFKKLFTDTSEQILYGMRMSNLPKLQIIVEFTEPIDTNLYVSSIGMNTLKISKGIISNL